VATHQRAWACNASTILFHTPDLSMSDLPTRARHHDHQQWVLYSAEAPINDPDIMFDPASLRIFDHTYVVCWSSINARVE
jgi:hypothetical protein